MIKKNIWKYFLVALLYSISSIGVANHFYFTDIYGNKVEYIYTHTQNYLSIHEVSNNESSIIDIQSYKGHTICSYNSVRNEVGIYTQILAPQILFIYIENDEGLDSIPLQVVQPSPKFAIVLAKESLIADTLKIKYKRSVFIELQIEERYKFLTKFEDNIYLLSNILWNENKYDVIIRRNSYGKYELLIPYHIFKYKEKIDSPVTLVIYPYILVNKSEPKLLLHNSFSCIVKIE